MKNMKNQDHQVVPHDGNLNKNKTAKKWLETTCNTYL